MGRLLNIQRFCTRDGPGIRTTVFFKGCPLRCVWCHNPETQKSGRELMYDAEKCVHCLRCVPLCPQHCHTAVRAGHILDQAQCVACGACILPRCDALELCGFEMSAQEVLREVCKDRLFYENSGGGLTLSGGEPLYQPAFCDEILQLAKDLGLHTCLETCGVASLQTLQRIAPLVDLFLWDCKHTDPDRHKALTGVGTADILRNLKWLDEQGKPVVLRCPLIPGENDTATHLAGIAQLANEHACVREIVVEPYHAFGTDKYRRLGRVYALPLTVEPNEEAIQAWIAAIQRLTDVPVNKA